MSVRLPVLHKFRGAFAYRLGNRPARDGRPCYRVDILVYSTVSAGLPLNCLKNHGSPSPALFPISSPRAGVSCCSSTLRLLLHRSDLSADNADKAVISACRRLNA